MNRLSFVLALLALFFLVSPATNSQAAPNFGPVPIPTWYVINLGLPDSYNLNGVYTVDGIFAAWIVGNDGGTGKALKVTLNPDTMKWQVAESYDFRAPLNAVVALSDDNVWAVGLKGLIVHKDSNGWHEVASPLPDAELFTVQMFGNGSEGWAAGSSGFLHYRNGNWEKYNWSSQAGLFSLNFGGGGGYAVSGPYVWRYSKGTWIADNDPLQAGDELYKNSLYGVVTINADEAWAVGSGSRQAALGAMQVFHRTAGHWQGAPVRQLDGLVKSSYLLGMSIDPNGDMLAVGSKQINASSQNQPVALFYTAFTGWAESMLPDTGGRSLAAVSHSAAKMAIAVGNGGLVMSYGYADPIGNDPTPTATPASNSPSATATPTQAALAPTQTATAAGPTATPASQLPTDRVSDPGKSGVLYFPVVGHTLQGVFRNYWQAHGGLEQFGYPLTEEFQETSPTDGKSYTVQYFERARFEQHSDNQPPYDVLLGLLGRTITTNRTQEAPFQPAPQQTGQGAIYFPETGHNMPAQFADYWQTHGGLPVYGYPISEAFQETSPTDGKPYLVQYFERNRFEYHPELPDAYRVSLGLLGVQLLKDKGWIH